MNQAKVSFQWLWLGQLVSNLGTQSSLYGIGLWMFQQQGRVADFALVALVVQVARILALPLLGRWMSHWPRRRLMVIANGVGAVCTLALASQLLQAPTAPSLAPVLSLQALAAMAEACLVLCFASLIPLLFPDGNAQARANGLFASGDGLAASLAPFLGSWLVGLGGLQSVLSLDACSFAIALGCVLAAPWPRSLLQPAPSPQRQSISLLGWWRPRPAGLIRIVSVSAGMAWVYAVTEILYPAWVSLQFGARAMGPVLVVGVIGYAAGVGIWQLVGPALRRVCLAGSLAVQGLVLLGIALALVPSVPWLWLGGQALFSTTLPLGLAALQTHWCQMAPPNALAPVMAVRYGCDWIARLTAFAFCSVAVDQWIKPALQGTMGSLWLDALISQGSTRPLALTLAAAGVVLLGCLGPGLRLRRAAQSS